MCAIRDARSIAWRYIKALLYNMYMYVGLAWFLYVYEIMKPP